jgi:hypothetical protein
MRAPRQNRAASITTFASLDHRHTPVDLCACDVVGWIDASFSGVIFCFRTSRAAAFWDGRPVPIKRPESGKFHWPGVEDGMVGLSAIQLAARGHAARDMPAPEAVQ